MYFSTGDVGTVYTDLFTKTSLHSSELKKSVSQSTLLRQDVYVSTNTGQYPKYPLGLIEDLSKGYDNNLGTTLNLTSGKIEIEMPLGYTGALEIVLSISITPNQTSQAGWYTTLPTTNPQPCNIYNVLTEGSVSPLKDMYGVENGNERKLTYDYLDII
jgi:hypothetical protein